ncbi:MAG: hypothetical protein ACWA5L_02165 [bacterium]
MKLKFAIFAIASLIVSTNATNAQTNNLSTTENIVDMIASSWAFHQACILGLSEENVSDFEADRVCACANGYIGGQLTDRQYVILGYVSLIAKKDSEGATEAEIQAIVNDFISSGYTEAELNEVLTILDTVGNRGDIICAPYQPKSDKTA